MKKIQLGSWREYEENIEFDAIVFMFNDGLSLAMSGYNGLWEMLHYEKLRDECKQKFLNGMVEWARWELAQDKVSLQSEIEKWETKGYRFDLNVCGNEIRYIAESPKAHDSGSKATLRECVQWCEENEQ